GGRRDDHDRRSGEADCGRGGIMNALPVDAKVLLIDANAFFARRISDALKLEGFDVVHSTQSAFALTMVEYDTPSAILCCTNLREISAHDLPKIIHGEPKTAPDPVSAIGEGGDQPLLQERRSVCARKLDKR